MVGSFIFKEEVTMEVEKITVSDSKLAGYILDELFRRAYKIDDFDVRKDHTGRYEHYSFVVDIDDDTWVDVTIEERHSILAGDNYTELHYAYSLSHGCDNFPTILKLRKGDLLEVDDDPRDNESSLKVRLNRWRGHTDIVEHEVDRDMVKNFIDEILKRLEVKDLIE